MISYIAYYVAIANNAGRRAFLKSFLITYIHKNTPPPTYVHMINLCSYVGKTKTLHNQHKILAPNSAIAAKERERAKKKKRVLMNVWERGILIEGLKMKSLLCITKLYKGRPQGGPRKGLFFLPISY